MKYLKEIIEMLNDPQNAELSLTPTEWTDKLPTPKRTGYVSPTPSSVRSQVQQVLKVLSHLGFVHETIISSDTKRKWFKYKPKAKVPYYDI